MDQFARGLQRRLPVFLLVNVNLWHPDRDEFERCLSLVTDRAYVTRLRQFHKGYRSAAECPHHEMPDPKCFVVAQLLYQLAFGAGNVGRTVEGKPVMRRPHSSDLGHPNETSPTTGCEHGWRNANASHAGGVVAFAALEVPGAVVGCDVMPVELSPPEPITERSVAAFFGYFDDYFTMEEWRWIRAAVDGDYASASHPMNAGELRGFYALKRFLTLWTLKEAIIKAMGIGLGFELQRASFRLSRADVWAEDFYSPVTSVQLVLDGVERPDWYFSLHERRDWNAVAATAVGPIAAARESSFVQSFDAALVAAAESAPLEREELCSLVRPLHVTLIADANDVVHSEDVPSDPDLHCGHDNGDLRAVPC